MQYSIVAVLALAASVAAQGVTEQISPKSSAPPGCQKSVSGTFTFQTTNVSSTAKRSLDEFEDLNKRQTQCGNSVTLTLHDGILLDSLARTGYIASNRQLQFDGPPQAKAIFTAGFSVCGNGSLALGGSTVFWNCLSGTFDNIYDQSQGAQCYQVLIDTFPCLTTAPVPTVPTVIISAPGEQTDSLVSGSPATSMSMMVLTAQPSAPSGAFSSVSSAPYAAGNSSTVAVVGTGSATAPPTTSAPQATSAAGGAGSSPAPSSFKGAADILSIGQGFVAMVAAAGAFFML